MTDHIRKSAWFVARFLVTVGQAFAGWTRSLLPKSSYSQLLADRLLHVNEAVGHVFPQMRRVLTSTKVEGFDFVFRPFTDDMDRISQVYEPSLRNLLSPGKSDVLIDIGANIGRHSLWFSKQVGPTGKVFAIEPDDDNYRVLALNRLVNGSNNLVLVRAAISSRPGSGELVLPKRTSMGKIRAARSNGLPVSHTFSVDFETLDGIVEKLSPPRVSGIKIDVEGGETSVLEGASLTIGKYRPKLVIEIHGKKELESVVETLSFLKMTVVAKAKASNRADEQRLFVMALPSELSRKSKGHASQNLKAGNVQ